MCRSCHKGSAMKQYEAVIQTLERLGGQATLAERCREVMKIKRSALDAIKSRVNFLGYNLLVKQYEYEMLRASQEFAI
ncbi:MAG: hypothetical protein HGA23_06110 [Bacteroidales bacterium]|nr:hypothetical protein [Bacteroidales bacterium]